MIALLLATLLSASAAGLPSSAPAASLAVTADDDALYTPVAVVFKEWHPEAIPAIFAACGADPEPDKLIPQLRSARALVAEGVDPVAVVKALRARPEVERAYVEPWLYPQTQAVTTHDTATNDPGADSWHLRRIGAYAAWRHTKGSASIKVAAVDSGALPHEDLDLWTEGYNAIDDIADGTNFLPTSAFGVNVHGTTVHSIIALRHGNSIGGAGVAPGVNFMPVNIYSGTDLERGLLPLDFADAIVTAVDAGARVINDSNALGVAPHESWYADVLAGMTAAMDYAWNAGALVVTAAGNNGYDLDHDYVASGERLWPLQEIRPDHQLVVGAIESTDVPAVFNPSPPPLFRGTNYGSSISITAPGKDLYGISPSAWPLEYGLVRGTSFASPCVASAAALVFTINPALTNAQGREIILSTTSEPLASALTTYRAKFPTQNILDTGAAVTKAVSTLPANAGVPFPYAHFLPISLTTVSAGVATTTLSGPVEMDVRGYADGAAVPRVVLDLGGTTLYDGPPARLTGTASATGTALPLTLRACTAASVCAEETYSDVSVSSLSVSAGGPVRQVKDRAGNTGVFRDRAGNAVRLKARE